MADRVEINMSSIKARGSGGLGMLAMVGVVAYAMPEARQFVLLSYGAAPWGPSRLLPTDDGSSRSAHIARR